MHLYTAVNRMYIKFYKEMRYFDAILSAYIIRRAFQQIICFNREKNKLCSFDGNKIFSFMKDIRMQIILIS